MIIYQLEYDYGYYILLIDPTKSHTLCLKFKITLWILITWEWAHMILLQWETHRSELGMFFGVDTPSSLKQTVTGRL